jgi:hypothetical protein
MRRYLFMLMIITTSVFAQKKTEGNLFTSRYVIIEDTTICSIMDQYLLQMVDEKVYSLQLIQIKDTLNVKIVGIATIEEIKAVNPVFYTKYKNKYILIDNGLRHLIGNNNSFVDFLTYNLLKPHIRPIRIVGKSYHQDGYTMRTVSDLDHEPETLYAKIYQGKITFKKW